MEVDSIQRAKIQIDYLEKIENQHIEDGQYTSSRWAIEFNERYDALDEGLYELAEEDDVEIDPSDVLSAVDEENYDRARLLLKGEDNQLLT